MNLDFHFVCFATEKPYGLTYSNGDDVLEKPHEGKHAKSKAGVSNQWADLVEETLAEKDVGIEDECVVRYKNVLKCRWCPKKICLSNASMQSHLMSKVCECDYQLC